MLNGGPRVQKVRPHDVEDTTQKYDGNYLRSSPSKSSFFKNEVRTSKSPQGSDYRGLRMKSNNDRSLSYHSRGSGMLLGELSAGGMKKDNIGNDNVYRSPTFISQTY